jgi:archaeal preflagellin peptidase FlaK
MFVYLAIIVSLAGLMGATYTDLKERIVPNKLNYGLALIGILIFLTQSIFEASFLPLIFSVFGLAFGFLFGWIMWKLGVFAGGDVKLFMALGALNPFTFSFINYAPLGTLSFPIFPITLFINSLIAFLPYGLFIIIMKLKKNKKVRKKLFKKMKKNIIYGAKSAILLTGLYTIFSFFNLGIIIEIIFMIILGAVIERKFKQVIPIIALTSLVINWFLFLQLLFGFLIIVSVFYSIVKLMLSSGEILVEKIKIKDLEEGMIPKDTLVLIKGKIKIIKFSLKTLGKYKGKEIISSMKARGLTEKEIKELKKLHKAKKIKNNIRIKQSMAFVPTILLGYLITLFIGDLILILVI